MILALVVVSSIITTAYAPVTLPAVYVDPEVSTANPGNTFTIDVNVQDISDLYSWGVRMYFNPNVLQCISVQEGPFLKGQPGGSIFISKIYLSYFDAGSTSLGIIPGVNGSGTLMNATFLVKDSGKSNLDLDETMTKLLDSTLTAMNRTLVDGLFYTPAAADLVRRSAWPEHHHFVISKDEDFDGTYANQSLFCKVKNTGSLDLYVYGRFDIVRDDALVTTVTSGVVVVPPDTIVTLRADFTVSGADAGKYYVTASARYSWTGYYYTSGDKFKTFSFAVVA